MMKPSDNDVEKWLAALHQEKYDEFVGYAARCFRAYGPSAIHRAEDAVQISYEKVWLKRNELITKDNPVAWFYGILKRTIQELYKDDMRWQKHIGQIVVLMVTTGGTEFVLRSELKSMMTDEEFQLLKRLYIDKETYDEVSAATGVKKSTLAMRVRRLKERIVEDDEKD